MIFTELIVILSFVSRFSLDRQITDLNDSIFQKQTIIESFGDLEKNMRAIQKKLDNYTQVEPTAELVDIFPELQKITPPGIELSQLIIKSGSISFTGTTASQPTLNTLINNLELSPAFSDVQVNKIETSQEQQGRLQFVIQAVPTIGGGAQPQPSKKPASNANQPASWQKLNKSPLP